MAISGESKSSLSPIYLHENINFCVHISTECLFGTLIVSTIWITRSVKQCTNLFAKMSLSGHELTLRALGHDQYNTGLLCVKQKLHVARPIKLCC